jgi:hypothetical protein
MVRQRMNVSPRQGVGDAKFGQQAEEVQRLVGVPVRRVRNIEQYASGWNFHYDDKNRLEFAETWSPEAVAALEGVNLIGLAAGDARELLVRLGGDPRDVLGDSDRYDLALCVGFTGDPVESVWVFPPNYYVERAVPGSGP